MSEEGARDVGRLVRRSTLQWSLAPMSEEGRQCVAGGGLAGEASMEPRSNERGRNLP